MGGGNEEGREGGGKRWGKGAEGGDREEDSQCAIDILGLERSLGGVYVLVYGCCDTLVFEARLLRDIFYGNNTKLETGR